MSDTRQGIAELPSYTKLVEKFLDAQERQDLIDYLAEHPKSGDILEGTSGVRKLRWRRGGQGKSGGVRVVYYYHDDLMPLYLLTIFAKNDKENLTKAERNELAGLVGVLVNIWKKQRKS
ncbi:MAG: type II toxin-antitoxin system RelE/ParE family toxin [Pigmentiphaga sp.]|nr:type II toxin-antitoxin system RelE/ParE family toxin [Pigmentiphaga sp.]